MFAKSEKDCVRIFPTLDLDDYEEEDIDEYMMNLDSVKALLGK